MGMKFQNLKIVNRRCVLNGRCISTVRSGSLLSVASQKPVNHSFTHYDMNMAGSAPLIIPRGFLRSTV